ncbi:hypothetical protein [Agrobacterium sp. MCAB5]|uniref:hypothetical protein n=1 Tax=Agrobacterium sp. MCAB5 TaxID=3233042 RepID=UPI003F926994
MSKSIMIVGAGPGIGQSVRPLRPRKAGASSSPAAQKEPCLCPRGWNWLRPPRCQWAS